MEMYLILCGKREGRMALFCFVWRFDDNDTVNFMVNEIFCRNKCGKTSNGHDKSRLLVFYV